MSFGRPIGTSINLENIFKIAIKLQSKHFVIRDLERHYIKRSEQSNACRVAFEAVSMSNGKADKHD